MIRRRALAPLALAFALAFSASPARAEKETFVLDKNHTEIGFKVRHFVSKVGGHFGKFDGTIVLDRTKPEESSVELRIEAASIDTGNPNREKHLNSPDFFDTAKYPEITFKSTKVTPKGKDVFDVTGDLTIRGVTKPVTLNVTANGFASDGRGGQKAGFDVTGKLNRRDFGVNWNAIVDQSPMLSDDVDLVITVEANKPAPKSAAPAAPAAPATK
ncbi:MAG TPA: YceI family protein [Thermoanaerobaculia bacterium]|nr:YceI family protein [Thermoanaerobaculia bacterium]